MSNINLKNIKSFILGNVNYYLDKIIDLPIHLKEQYYYRLYTCKDTCLMSGRCKICNCPTIKKAFSPDSCNKELFPDFLPGLEWKEYKEKNNINNIESMIQEIEQNVHKR